MAKTDPQDAHYCLSEDQEHTIYRVRQALEFAADLANMAPRGKTPAITHEGLSCFLSILAELLPGTNDMAFVSGFEMRKLFSHRANDDGGPEGEA